MATDFSVLLLLANFFVVDSSSSSLVVTPNVIYAEEGGSASYTVALGSQPTGLVKVRVSSSNSTLVDVVSSPIFSESNWSTPVSIVVAASDDAWGAFEEHDVELTNSCVGCDDVFVRLVIFDDDACVRNCQPGFHSTSCNMTRSCVPCPIGYTCAGGCETPTPCEAGKFAAQSGTADQCATCPSGTFTTEYGSSSCFECTAGYHCSDPSTPKACPAGMTSAARSIECTNCTAGRYARLEGQTTCESCPAGFECQNTYEATPCDPGTFSEGNQTKCSACPAGYACSSTGASPRVCADGSYSLTNWQYCVVCPPGHYCINVAYPPTKCAAGTFTAAGNATHCDTCPVGRYTGNVTGSATCILCPRGYSCYDPTVEPIACENGTFSELGNAICDACELGRYSHAASDVCHPCPEGYSCPRPSENPVACTQGKYSTSSDVSCSPCDVGRLSASDHTRCEDCPAGFQ